MSAPSPAANGETNAALLCAFSDPDGLSAALSPALQGQKAVLITDRESLLTEFALAARLPFAAIGLDHVPVEADDVLDALRSTLTTVPDAGVLIVDMSWSISAALGARSFEGWSHIAERIAARPGIDVISLYDVELLVEDQLQAAFRAHQQFLAPSGRYENPYWLPTELRNESTLDEQLSFMLGRIVPDFAGGTLFKSFDRLAARGASPNWLAAPRHAVVGASGVPRWHIHCLGPLRVQVAPGQQVDWHLPGGAPKKTKTLFAYLLNAGDKGVHADQIGELLWQGEGSEKTKRARLHHTVAMLRKTLGSQETIERSGDYYRLIAPAGSWLDITIFEQLCRRGLSMARHGNNDAALRLYNEAEQLYVGDLFEDLPHEYLVTETEDWILPRRIWLREMAIRVEYDHSKLLRRYRRYAEALDHALKAVTLDPTNESANAEAMRVFHAQGRTDAMHRQFRAYRAALSAIGESAEGLEIRATYDELCRSLDRLTPHQRKTKELVLR